MEIQSSLYSRGFRQAAATGTTEAPTSHHSNMEYWLQTCLGTATQANPHRCPIIVTRRWLLKCTGTGSCSRRKMQPKLWWAPWLPLLRLASEEYKFTVRMILFCRFCMLGMVQFGGSTLHHLVPLKLLQRVASWQSEESIFLKMSETVRYWTFLWLIYTLGNGNALEDLKR